jgi:hypothetical protein
MSFDWVQAVGVLSGRLHLPRGQGGWCPRVAAQVCMTVGWEGVAWMAPYSRTIGHPAGTYLHRSGCRHRWPNRVLSVRNGECPVDVRE